DRVVRLEAARVLAPLLRQQLPDQFRDQLQQAVEEYAQAQYVTADRPESQLNLGLIAVAVGDAPQAEQAYRAALRLDPGFAPAYANLADLYRQQGQDAQGEVLLRAGMAAARDNPDLPHALGLLLVREKRLTEALPYLRQAAESAADRPRYAYVYALALQGAGNPAEALAVLGRANQRHPGDRDILQALVSLHRELGQTEQAERFAQELATRYPQEAAQQLQ
ncbi:MAG: hypothetical protein RLZ44_1550, partial [Pseudomonadota bacterium]